MEEKDDSVVLSEDTKKISKLESKIEQLEAELKLLNETRDIFDADYKQLKSFKDRTENLSSFKEMGGKEEYYDAYAKMKDELGQEPTKKEISAFKQKYSNFFNEAQEGQETPTNAISGDDGVRLSKTIEIVPPDHDSDEFEVGEGSTPKKE